MAASARIDELRSKFDENPRRYFAPLANEYRKAGDLGSSIAICRAQLRQFPTHMSGHVVLGQALYEAGELPEARHVFERAVELDPENLIALRHLGDIARALGETGAATSWYRRVLDADPYNEQIAALVAEMSAPPQAAAAEPAAAEPPAARHDAPEIHDGPPPASPDVEFIDLSADDFRWAPPTPASGEPVEPEAVERPDAEPASAEARSPETAGAPGGFETTTFEFVDEWVADVPPTPAAVEEQESDTRPTEELSIEALTLDEVPPADGAPFDPVVGLDLVPVHDAAEEALEKAEPAPAPVAPAGEPWPAEEAAGLDLVTSGAFATETMAELCLEQGHEEEALAIFDRLLAQRPGDAALADRVASLRARLHPAADDEPTAGAFLRDLAERRVATDAAPVEPGVQPDAEPGIEPAAAPEPPGEPVREARPTAELEPESAPAPVGERDAWAAAAWRDAFRADVTTGIGLVEELAARPSTPPPVDLSFDRFFTALESVEPATVEPATAAPVAAEWREEAPLALVPADDGPSQAAAPAPAPAPAPEPGPASAPAPEGDEDLAEFNAWLRGLRDT